MRGRKRLDFSNAHSRLHKVFYIHCPGYPRESWLRREIIKFGGKIEAFLSKDVHVLITNQQNGDRGSSLSNPPPTPLTPLSPLSACTSSSRMWMDSPLSTENPSAAATVMTRGKALALQAAKTQCNGSTDVLENSKRLGVRVWSLESAVRVVGKARREENRRSMSSASSKTLAHGAKTLKPPFLKVEDCSNRFKPLFSEFEYWPIMDYLDKMNLDPGFDHGKLITPCSPPLEPVSSFKSRNQPLIALRRLDLRIPPEPLPLPPSTPPSQLRGKGSGVELGRQKKRERRTKPSAACPEQKGILKKQLVERRGYCEACLARYNCIQEHRGSVPHQEFIANAAHFSRLDRVISECVSLDQVVENFSSVMSIFSDSVSCSPSDVTSPLPHSNTPCISPTYSVPQSPYTPSKVWDSARNTPLTCISFRPEATLLSYTTLYENKPTSPFIRPATPDLILQTSLQSTPRATNPLFSLPQPIFPATPYPPPSPLGEEVRRSYTIPIDSPSHGTKPEITLLIPSSSPEPSAMEWCESISQICPRVVPLGERESLASKEDNPTLSRPLNEAIAETVSQFITPDQTPTRQTRDSNKWLKDGRTPPLPKNMDPHLFKFINYPYREAKVDAFKKLSKLL